MATCNVKSDRTLRLGRRQYRELAEKAKAVGMGLTLSTYQRLGCWGQYSSWGLPVIDDVTRHETKFNERSLITLSFSIDAAAFRAAGRERPEVDWSVLDDRELYTFVLQHEIGHRCDNFDSWDVRIEDPAVQAECVRRLRYINEVLADRFAWQAIRPGEPLPLTEHGRRDQERISDTLALLGKHVRRTSRFTREPLPAGQYRGVPDYMIATNERAEFVGPQVDRQLLQQRVEYHRARLTGGARPMF